MIFRWISLVLVSLTSVAVSVAKADELAVVSLPAYKPLFEKLTPAFATATGHKLTVEFGTFPQIKGRLDSGDYDVAITSAATTDYVLKGGKALPESRVDFSKVGIAVAVPAGAPKPDISTADAFKRAMLNAKTISVPIPESGAGGYLVKLFDKLGIAADLQPKLKVSAPVPLSTPKAIAAREVEIGMTLSTEFLYVAGLDVVGPLSADIQASVVQTATISATAKHRAVAETFLKFLKAPPAVPLIKAEGLEPL